MAVFTAGKQRYVWPDGSTQRIPPPSRTLAATVQGSLRLIDDKPISYRRIYRTQPWVAAAVHMLARQIARLPLHVFRPTEDVTGAAVNRERVRPGEHQLARLLASPAVRRSPVDLKTEIAHGLLVDGNHLERIVTQRGIPVRLEKIEWTSVIPHLSEDDLHVVVWEVRPSPTAEPEYLGPEEVLHFRWSAPDGPIGVSPLEHLGVTIRSENAAQRYAESGLKHGGMRGIGVLLSKDASTDPDQRETLRQEILHRYSGPDRAHMPYVLGGVESIEQIPGQTAVEAELINQRYVNREEIAAVYGVPPVLIGDLRHATYSNVNEMHSMLYLTFLAPWLELIAGQTQAQLVAQTPEWAADGVWVEWNLDEVLKGDVRERMQAYKLGLAAGALTINDIRRKENLPPFPDEAADEPLIAANNLQPLSVLVPGADEQ